MRTRASHGKQGGSRFAEFMEERFGMRKSAAGGWAAIGSSALELSSNAGKFAVDWSAIYDFTRLPEDKQIELLEAPGVIDRKAVKRRRSSL